MFDKICLALSIIGCLNWGLVGVFSFDLVAWIFGGTGAILSRIVYTVIALAGVWCISLLFRIAVFIISQTIGHKYAVSAPSSLMGVSVVFPLIRMEPVAVSL